MTQARKHRWFHFTSRIVRDGDFLVHKCKCGHEMGRVHKSDPYRCPICDSRFCDEGNHH